MQNACRPSSAVQRFTQAPPRAVAAEGALDLAVVARQVVLGQEVDLERGAGDRRELATAPATTARRRARRSPSPLDHGTYSCGIHSWAMSRWRLRLRSATGSSAANSCEVSRSAMGSSSVRGRRGVTSVGPQPAPRTGGPEIGAFFPDAVPGRAGSSGVARGGESRVSAPPPWWTGTFAVARTYPGHERVSAPSP